MVLLRWIYHVAFHSDRACHLAKMSLKSVTDGRIWTLKLYRFYVTGLLLISWYPGIVCRYLVYQLQDCYLLFEPALRYTAVDVFSPVDYALDEPY